MKESRIPRRIHLNESKTKSLNISEKIKLLSIAGCQIVTSSTLPRNKSKTELIVNINEREQEIKF